MKRIRKRGFPECRPIAQIIWTYVGGSKTLIRHNTVTATPMVASPPSFSHILNLPVYVIQEIGISCADRRRFA